MAEGKYRRISKGSAFALILISIIFDAIELLVDLIPIIGTMISFFIDMLATITFAIWFVILGVGLLDIKNSKKFWLTNIIEFLPIPVLDTGILTYGIISTISNVQKEDSEKTEPSNPNITRPKRGKVNNK